MAHKEFVKLQTVHLSKQNEHSVPFGTLFIGHVATHKFASK